MTNLGTTRARWAALGAAIAVTIGAAGFGSLNIASADVSSGDRPVFISINPCRLVDTRPGDLNVGPRSTPLGASETVTVTAHGTNGECTGPSAIPTDAVGLSLNVTAVGPTANTFLTFWGDGDNPGTSNLNPRAGGAPTPNAVSTPLSATGTFNIFNNAGNVNVIVDVNGYYANHNHDDRYPLKGDVYTKTETDSVVDTATAPPAELLVSPFEFTPEAGTNWSVEGTLFRSDNGSTECAIAPLRIAAGQSIERIVIPWTATGSVRVEVQVIAPRHFVGTFESEADLFDQMIAVDVTGGAPPSGVIAELVVEPSTPPVAAADFTYAIQLCTSDAIQIFPIKVQFG